MHSHTFTHVHIKALIRHSNYRQTQYDLSRTHSQILTNGQIQTHTAGRHTETADTHRQQTRIKSRHTHRQQVDTQTTADIDSRQTQTQTQTAGRHTQTADIHRQQADTQKQRT